MPAPSHGWKGIDKIRVVPLDRTYIITNGGKARVVKDPNWDDGWEGHWFPGADPLNVGAWSIDGVAEDIFFNEELAGPDGMSFLLFPEPKHDSEAVKKAKKWLRNSRDVVRFHVRRIEFVKEKADAEAGN